MNHRPHIALRGLILFSFLVLAGCPPPNATSPEITGGASSTSPSPATQGSVGQSAAARESRQAREARGAEEARQARELGRAPSSLEAMRRGEQSLTPVSSPLQEIYFGFDRYDLLPEAREVLKRNADWLRVNSGARVEIEGHCDERGTNEYNLALGAKRAQATKDYLVSLGIAAARLSTISYGEEVPVCREATDNCWQRNRRARFVILSTRPAS